MNILCRDSEHSRELASLPRYRTGVAVLPQPSASPLGNPVHVPRQRRTPSQVTKYRKPTPVAASAFGGEPIVVGEIISAQEIPRCGRTASRYRVTLRFIKEACMIVDLSHLLEPGLPAYPRLPSPQFQGFSRPRRLGPAVPLRHGIAGART